MTEKLSRRQEEVLERMAATPLMRLPEGGYRFADGAPAHWRPVRELIRRGLIEPAGDGLFPGFHQTLRRVEGHRWR